MARTAPIALMILMAISVSGTERYASPEDFGLAFWRSLQKGDLKTMHYCYSEIVLIMAHSGLLNSKWGIVSKGHSDTTQLVHRDRLIKGYNKMISSYGKRRWPNLFNKKALQSVSYTNATMRNHPYLGVVKGDKIMRVKAIPGKRDFIFVLRRLFGRWYVVMEYSDY